MKKSTLILMIFFQFYAIEGNSQSNPPQFLLKVSEARRLMKKGDYNNAILTLEASFKEMEYVHSSHLLFALNISKKNKDKERISFYKRKVKQSNIVKDKKIEKIVDSVLVWDQKIRKRKYQKKIRNYLMWKNDSLKISTKKFLKAKFYFNDAMRIDSLNQLSVLKILQMQGGYKGNFYLGGKKEYHFLVMLVHMDNDTNNRILKPILDEALIKGHIGGKVYAQILDRHSYHTSGTQKYWAWPTVKAIPKLSSEERLKIEEKRKELGLMPKFRFLKVRGEYIIQDFE